jgi:hypothetical protein
MWKEVIIMINILEVLIHSDWPKPDATGNVNAVMRFQTVADRSAGAAQVQETNEDDVPLWDVEALLDLEAYGKKSTEPIRVRVPAIVQPNVPKGPVQFAGFKVTFKASKGQCYWAADGIELTQKSMRNIDHVSA